MVSDTEYLKLLDKKLELQRKIFKIQVELGELRAKLFEAERRIEGIEQIENQWVEFEAVDRR